MKEWEQRGQVKHIVTIVKSEKSQTGWAGNEVAAVDRGTMISVWDEHVEDLRKIKGCELGL